MVYAGGNFYFLHFFVAGVLLGVYNLMHNQPYLS